jgi:sulfur transfer protein SufE
MTKRCKIIIFSGENGTLSHGYLPNHSNRLELTLSVSVYGVCHHADLLLKGQALKQREQQLRFVVQQADLLAAADSAEHLAANEVFGCEARVWVHCHWQHGLLHLQVDSQARVVKGLLALIHQALQGANAEQLAHYDLDAHFQALHLDNYLTVSRRNGLRAVVARIQGSTS